MFFTHKLYCTGILRRAYTLFYGEDTLFLQKTHCLSRRHILFPEDILFRPPIYDHIWSIYDHIWTIYDHTWFIFDHIWTIDDHIWTIYDHIWFIFDHIWTIYDHVWN